MYKVQMKQANATAAAHIFLSFLMAPLLTLSTSVQVSSPLHRVTLNDLVKIGPNRLGVGDHAISKGGNKFLQMNLKDKAETVDRTDHCPFGNHTDQRATQAITKLLKASTSRVSQPLSIRGTG